LANCLSLTPLNIELKDLEDFDSNISIEGRPTHHRKDPRGLEGPDEFASHPQEQRTSSRVDLEKEFASEELRSLRTHSTAKSEGEWSSRAKQLSKVWRAEKWATTILVKSMSTRM
jgi:hypothetical protein